ncbi:protein-tyrosine-phosphatase [Flavobacterium sp. NRK F10]|uniref:arsenate-mycothiol transferase ArsC n=1 Tax=Flavobacterium sp. NRK F10 TaxID=2954931 RepID=UPI0020900769|nr:protein-tyrosine-phosphatase [Flavobacterium sp. NRK F10]MCO6173573.1 protein-tyrosine-phosphatase [Flavobacterium sp. NRK F10]
MYSKLLQTLEKITDISVSNERKEVLQSLIDFIQNKVNSKDEIRLNFICTHNSRRSHLGQIWAQTMAFHFGIPNVYSYSGGTEATAMFSKIVETLTHQGFNIEKLSESTNPVYAVKFDSSEAAVIGFSKKYDDTFNPEKGFAAIMTCSQADGGCPFIAGAEKRIPITYEDPKAFDGTELMNAKYEERSLEIASEMYYVFSQIKK